MHRITPILTALLVLAASSAAQGQLIRQSTQGASRICLYRGAASGGVERRRARAYRVGLGEPCPRTMPSPQTERRRIPALARLSGHYVDRGRRHCVYNDQIRDYVRLISIASRCPLTPHF